MIRRASHQKPDVIAVLFADGADDHLRRVSGAVVDADDAAVFSAVKKRWLRPADIVRDTVLQKSALDLPFAVGIFHLTEFNFVVYF